MIVTRETSSDNTRCLDDIMHDSAPLIARLIQSGYERRKSTEQPPNERLKPEYQNNLVIDEMVTQ